MIFSILCFLFSIFILVFIVYWLTTRAIIFSRVVMAFGIALFLSNYGYEFVPDRGFLNFIAWAMISFGVIYFLTILPRVDISMRFFCSIFVSLITTELVASLVGSLINDLAVYEITTLHEIVNKVISVGISVFSIINAGKKFESESSDHLIVRIFDRTLASLLYSISFVILALPIHGSWGLSLPVLAIIVVGGFVGMFVADVFLAKKYLFGYALPEEVEVSK